MNTIEESQRNALYHAARAKFFGTVSVCVAAVAIGLAAIALLSGCANTSQTFDPGGAGQKSSTMPLVRIDDASFNASNSTPQNVISMNSGGIARTDVASAGFAGASTNAGAVAFNFAQDAKGKGLVWKAVYGADGYLESIEFKADEYDGSGSASITASAPLVQEWAGLLRALSADERDRFLKAMDTVNSALATAVRAALAANGVVTPAP